jgi:uncharacterized protein (DUF608 family)
MNLSAPKFITQHGEGLQVALPLGGLGAGCICLNGQGGLQDFSIWNRPDTTAVPDGHDFSVAAFAVVHVKGKEPVTRLVERPMPAGKIYDQSLQAQGYRHGGHEGLPRFRKSIFRGGYPFGRVELSDAQVPLRAEITGWNPFIPGDDVASGLPCSILEYRFRNTTRRRVDFEFSYHLSHLAPGAAPWNAGGRNEAVPSRGVYFYNHEPSTSEDFGSASLTVIGHRPRVKAMWLRGGWFDAVSALWREVETGRFEANGGRKDAGRSGRNGGSILMAASLRPGAEINFPIVITWHFPNSNLEAGSDRIHGPHPRSAGDFSGTGQAPKWHPFYSTIWSNAKEVCSYVHKNYGSLRRRTVAFQNALFASTVPVEVLDAVSANLAILKSPTVLRQQNGNVWGWEGCFTNRGCCAGSCTHVWNYAQSLPHLFPKLERTLREGELVRSMDQTGHVNFRASLPDGPASHKGHAAADGQLGGIMKVCRDWQISGDTAWLRTMVPLARASLDYCIRTFDPDRCGALFEPHHNTYDIEFWGPDAMCTSIYVGALSAMAQMLVASGDPEGAKGYDELAEKGASFLDRELFNGEYYHQKVEFKTLRNKWFLDLILGRNKEHRESAERLELLKREGPCYQYGSGCLSDGVIGAWMASLYGIQTPLNRKNVRGTLRSIFRHNFRRSLAGHANTQRPGYALGNEAGLILCSWPRGGKPTLPFVYSDEVWTGIEYQVAAHMIAEGFMEGLEIVKAVRRRYDGRTRNPWNEYECGSYYARAMSSYAVLIALSGFRYSAVEKTLWLAPKLNKRPFQTFFSTASGFGTISLDRKALSVSIVEGELAIERIHLTLDEKEIEICASKTARPNRPARFPLKRK